MKHRALSILTLAAAISMNTFAASDGKWLPKNAGAYMKQCFADDYDLASSGNYLDDGKVEYVDGRGWTFASPLSWNGWTGVAARFFAYAPYKGDISNAHSVRFSVLADQSAFRRRLNKESGFFFHLCRICMDWHFKQYDSR